MRTVRQAGIAGMLCFLLLVVAGLLSPLWNLPPTSAPAAEIVAYAKSHRGDLIAALFIYGIAMALFLFFAAGVYAFLREREQAPGVLSTTFAFGAVSLATMVMAGFVPMSVLAYRAPDPSAARPLIDLTFGLLAFSGLPTAVALGAYAALVRQSRPLPGWTGWLALLGAFAHVAIAASFAFSSGFLSLEGAGIVAIPATLFLWILAVSVALLRTPLASSPP